MKVLLVYPKCPDSFWSFTHALKFISKKAAVPPLGLITVSAMLPETWQKKLVDLNISALQTSDIQWADYVFISAMYIQKESVNKVITESKKWGKKIVAGGPLFTQEYPNYPDVDHFILNEAEITMPLFLADLNAGQPQRVYSTEEFADLSQTPVPDFHLLSVKDYAFMNIQVTRGCPFNCNFCEITSLLGHKVRMKSTAQIINELDVLYHTIKWRGPVSIVDDNLIGNKHQLKYNLLPAMKKWMQIHKYPFTFNMESSINLADDEELMSLLVETGLSSTFIGIETPEEKSLNYCNKVQNINRDLLGSVKKIQQAGIQVSAGFIVGFDSDTPSVFQRQIDFIQKSGIVSAMVGLLNAPKNTELYNQLKAENRLTVEATGNNTDFSMNFIPKMDVNELQEGYHKIINNIYSVKPYYKRVRRLLLNYNQLAKGQTKLRFSLLMAFLKSVFVIGFLNKGRTEYWKFIIWTLFNKPKLIVDALTYTVYGYHFRTVYGLRQIGIKQQNV
jgi:radical SAM superfamily enzyme YgiQ (UPF0313 family)